MTSSTTGDRRWGTARKSGMTVLGKVAVPKPINLPSQRSENHGLDPNVEIVPKGTHSWGSKSSLNAWGSLPLSPRTDSGTGSPSHLSNRPSSGGTGTRPSTGGSDKAHEPSANVLGSNSRPSSASGVLTYVQTSLTPLRPHSAETKPGSSHLSRFAEALCENPVAWGASGTAEKLGVSQAKNDEFSLTSGDFPSLGSEKECPGKSSEPHDHGSHVRPGSSSGRPAPSKERNENPLESDVSISNARSGNADSWRRDRHPYGEDGVRHGIEERLGDPRGPQPYLNPNFPLQHFNTWRGPPMNNHPGGMCYRGPPGAPPYGPPMGPGGFPMEAFPYYPPQVPPTALVNPQGPGPRAPNNGDIYRLPIPDAYAHPRMPVRPGFYPGPVPYEGYLGPPMGYYNPSDRDMPFVGTPPGSYGYNKNSGQGVYVPPGKPLGPEQVEPCHSYEPRGPHKVLLKPQEGRTWKDEGEWNESVTTSISEKGAQQRPSSSDSEWRSEHRKDGDVEFRRKIAASEASMQTIHHMGCGSSDAVKSKLPEQTVNWEACDDIPIKKEHAFSASPEAWIGPGDSSLIQKIEGLNAKARSSDARQNIISVSSREEQRNKSHVGNAKNSVNRAPVRNTRNIQATGSVDSASSGQADSASGIAVSRISSQGIHVRADQHSKGGVRKEDNDGWRKERLVSDSSSAISAASTGISSNARVHEPSNVEAFSLGRKEGESGAPALDLNDKRRAMMREVAKPCVIQRQKEEEEQARDQRPKAVAKLEELNRHTLQAAEDLTKKAEAGSASAITHKLEESGTVLGSNTDSITAHDVFLSVSGNTTSKSEKPKVSSGEARKSPQKEALPLKEDVSDADTGQSDNRPHVDSGVLKYKRVGYKQKQNLVSEKKFSNKPSSVCTTEAVDVSPCPEVVANEVVSSHDSNVNEPSSVRTESPTHPRRKNNNRNGKKKQKEEISSMAASGTVVSKETHTGDESVESVKPKLSETESDSRAVQSPMDSKEIAHSTEQHMTVSNDDAQGRANNQWKSQHSRRSQRYLQVNKPAEKSHGSDALMWAPVRQHNKTEAADKASQKAVDESVSASSKSESQLQNNNPRNKRSDMEIYVPKPIAKEMAQQSVTQQENNVQKEDRGSQGTEISQPTGSASGRLVSALEFKNGHGRQNKHGIYGPWRQQGPAESTKALEDGQSSNSNLIVGKPVNHRQTVKNDVARDQPKYHDEWIPSDGWNMIPENPDSMTQAVQAKHHDEWIPSDGWNMIPENPDSMTLQAAPVVNDQGMTSHGKRQALKGHKGREKYFDDQKKTNNSGDANKGYVQHFGPEMSQAQRSTSRWQPKSQSSVASNQRGDRSGGSQSKRVQAGIADKKDFLEYHSLSDKSNTEEAASTENQEPGREQKMTSVKRLANSQNQRPANTEAPSERRPNSGYGKNTNQNRSFTRGQDSHGDWSLTGQDDWHHHHRPPSNHNNRQRHDSPYYDYQGVAAHNNDKGSNPEQPKDSTLGSVPRYQEKSQSQTTQGGEKSYRRQRGSIRRDAGYK